MARAKDVGRPVEHFYEAARQVTPLVEAATPFEDKPPVSAHGPSTSKGSRARTGHHPCGVKLFSLAEDDSEGIHPFIRARCGTRGAGARQDPRRSRALYGTALNSGQVFPAR
jgi:hypothetical protein